MSRITVIDVETEEQLERYVDFMSDHRKELFDWVTFRDFVELLCQQFQRGRIAIGLSESGETIGTFVYFIGTPFDNYRNTEAAFINVALLREDFRHTFAYLLGMTEVAERIARSGFGVKDVYFLAHKGKSPRLHGMYAKFADAYDDGTDEVYQAYRVSLAHMLSYCRKYEYLLRR